LEILNNIIQYQFDGNSNLVYTIIRKRNLFFNLLNLPIDQTTIDGLVTKKTNGKKTDEKVRNDSTRNTEARMEGALPAKEAEPGTLKATLAETPSILKMTEKSVSALSSNAEAKNESLASENLTSENFDYFSEIKPSTSINAQIQLDKSLNESHISKSVTLDSSLSSIEQSASKLAKSSSWQATSEWISSWKSKLPLQTIMRLLQVLVPQVEKICLDKGLTDESEILKFLQNGTLVGLLPVPHPILIRKYQPNLGTIMWFRTYLWGVIYLR
jgi:hypothetical protein